MPLSRDKAFALSLIKSSHPMKYLFILLVLNGLITSLNGQDNDSIARLINNYEYESALEKINQVHPDSLDTQTRYYKAFALKALSRFPQAIACYDSLYKYDSSNVKIALDLADCYKAVNNVSRPQEIYLKSLTYRSDNAYIMQLLANLYLTTEKYFQAKTWYLKACAGDTSEYLLKQIGYCYDKLTLDDSAVYFYLKAIAYDSNDYQPVFRLGNLYKDGRNYEKALAVTDTFLARHPENRDITRLSGYIHYLNQTFRKAVSRFEHSYELSDSSLFVNKYLGYSYFKLNEFKNAIRYMEKVYAVDSSDAELCYALGLAHDVPVSIRYFKAALALGLPMLNALPQVYSDLSLALTKDHKYDEALQALFDARRLAPGDMALVYKIAVHYDNWMDNKPMALKYYKDFLLLRNDTSSPYIVTGTAVIDRQDFDHAARRISDIEAVSTHSVVESDSIQLP